MVNSSTNLCLEDVLDPHRPHVTLEMQVQALTTELHQTTKALAASQADAARAKSALARLQGATVKGMTDTELAALEAEMLQHLLSGSAPAAPPSAAAPSSAAAAAAASLIA